MEIKVKCGDSFSRRVEHLIANGASVDEAVEAIKMIDYEMKHDPKKYLQPFIKAPNGEVIKNQEFYDIYGDPDQNFREVGKQDWREKLESDAVLKDMWDFRQGKFKSYSG